jgi:hypothetical protein
MSEARATSEHEHRVGFRSDRADRGAQRRPAPPYVELERGQVRFFARPRVEVETLASYADVQRFFFTLVPRAAPVARRIWVGKKRMPDDRRRERQWAFVDRVTSPADIVADVAAATYETKTRGVRHQAAAVELARGRYMIAAHGAHSHLDYELGDGEDGANASLLRQLRIVPRASYIAAVFNPERRATKAPAAAEDGAPPFREPSIYEDELMDRFGKRRFAALEPAFLDHEGAELVLIGGASARDRPDPAP